MSLAERQRAVSTLTTHIGVYALTDLDGVPIYVGQSVDGIRARVRRHLTSARSDIIANRQIDVWEVGYVLAWVVDDPSEIAAFEAAIFHHFDQQSTLMNGAIPAAPEVMNLRRADQTVAVLSNEERDRRIDPAVRLPRQIEHYQRLVDHILTVKDSAQLRRSLRAHYERLTKYHRQFLDQAGPEPVGSDDAQDV